MIGLDEQTNNSANQGKTTGESGRAGATGVRTSAAAAAAAIAPSTGTPEGVKALVSSMDNRLADMQRQIATTKAQNQLLATRLRQVVMAYRAAASPAAMSGALPGITSGGPGSGAGMFQGLGSVASPALTALRNFAPGSRGTGADAIGNDLFGGNREPSSAASRAVAYARSRIGAPYVWGAAGPKAFDCSGLVQWAYRQAGVSLDRTTYQMVNAGIPVSRSQIREGDLILCNWSAPRTPEHVMLAISPTMAIEAPTPGQSVHTTSIPTGRIEVRRVAA
ncbi:C40 family peptidase [Mycolicibacterium septicum]|uniref:C40 family peptidase n=1 Tax=Mycolicibacterium septicum TaxID=98668 RepID=UPI0023601686|nr:C40 family peptidase [Mycolicibacterium septicum]